MSKKPLRRKLLLCGVGFAVAFLCVEPARSAVTGAGITFSAVSEIQPEFPGISGSGNAQHREGESDNMAEIAEIIAEDRIAALAPGDLPDAEQVTGWEDSYFAMYPIAEGDAVYERICGKSYRENENIGLEELRYLKLLHFNFDHEIQVGELIVNADVAEDVLAVFRELFDAEYEIQSMYLVDNYWTGDATDSDTASIEANNSSAFNYREITGGGGLSNHALGRAIDINPQQNPYVVYRDGGWHWKHENATPYVDRECGDPHVIRVGDVCYNTFVKYGFDWGGEWENPIDYQHFAREQGR